MKRRELVMACVLLLCVVVYFGEAAVTDWLLKPLQDRNAKLATLEARVQEREAELRRIRREERKLVAWREQSLPSDPSVAATRYQNWLHSLTESTGWSNAVISPGRPVAEGTVFTRLPFSVQVRTGLGGLSDFLIAFQEHAVLQRVTEISLHLVGPGADPELDVTVQMEAISLAQADGACVFSGDPPRLPRRIPNVHESRIARNPFARGTAAGPEPEPSSVVAASAELPAGPTEEPSAPPPLDRAQFVYFIGTLIERENREAWLFDRSDNELHVVKEGGSIDLHDVHAVVLAVGKHSLLVEMDGKALRLELAKNLREMKEAPR